MKIVKNKTMKNMNQIGSDGLVALPTWAIVGNLESILQWYAFENEQSPVVNWTFLIKAWQIRAFKWVTHVLMHQGAATLYSSKF